MFRPLKCLIFCSLLILFSPYESFLKTCCWRHVGTQILFPYDPNSKVFNDMGFTADSGSGWDEVFVNPEHGGGPSLNCPLIDIIEMNPVKPAPAPPGLDYKFSGSYSIAGDGSAPRGYTVTLYVELVDMAHGTTVRSAESTWPCAPSEAGSCAKTRLQETINLAKTFQPLDKLLYDYERIPESLDIELKKDPILAGEQMTITLKNIKDANSRPSKSWQRILVKAEKGRILNGTALAEYKVFEVGAGSIDVEYEAPEKCQRDKETITIMNSCVMNPNMNAVPDQQIGTKTFDIFCVEGQIIVSWDPWHDQLSSVLLNVPKCNYSSTVLKNVPAVIKFRLKPSDDPCRYEVVQKGTAPSSSECLNTPSDMKHCLKFSISHQADYRLTEAYVDFRKNPDRPFFFSTDIQAKISIKFLNVPAPPMPDRETGWQPHHGNNWPLADGYQDEVLPLYQLRIDEKEVDRLKENCLKKK